jgi:hypothetical protein
VRTHCKLGIRDSSICAANGTKSEPMSAFVVAGGQNGADKNMCLAVVPDSCAFRFTSLFFNHYRSVWDVDGVLKGLVARYVPLWQIWNWVSAVYTLSSPYMVVPGGDVACWLQFYMALNSKKVPRRRLSAPNSPVPVLISLESCFGCFLKNRKGSSRRDGWLREISI